MPLAALLSSIFISWIMYGRPAWPSPGCWTSWRATSSPTSSSLTTPPTMTATTRLPKRWHPRTTPPPAPRRFQKHSADLRTSREEEPRRLPIVSGVPGDAKKWWNAPSHTRCGSIALQFLIMPLGLYFAVFCILERLRRGKWIEELDLIGHGRSWPPTARATSRNTNNSWWEENWCLRLKSCRPSPAQRCQPWMPMTNW